MDTQTAVTPLTLDMPLADALDESAAERLATVGLKTVKDLITCWPRKWRERGAMVDIALVPDNELATVHGLIKSAKSKPMRNGRRKFMVLDVVTTHGRSLEVSLFAVWQAQKDGIAPGATVTFSGKVKSFRGKRQMSSPEYVVEEEVTADIADTVIPIYSATATAPSEWIAEQVQYVLANLGPLGEHLPTDILLERAMPSYDWALRQMHDPHDMEMAKQSRARLVYDEAYAVQLSLVLRRDGAKAKATRALPGVPEGVVARFDAALPFDLTEGQTQAGSAIAGLLNSTKPANVLVEGEVGSGKTVVAMRAILQAIDSGSQCAFMAPTEVLASQHYEALSQMVDGLGVRIALLTSSMRAASIREVHEGVADGSIDLVVGTHVLSNGKITFDNLGLVVVDEQHRFGVEARDGLRAQPVPPHMIVMTATPIPRTMAMTVYGDLDVVELQGLPQGRLPIESVVVPIAKEHWVQRTWTRMAEEVAAGRQVFIVASRIGGGDVDDAEEAVNVSWDGDAAGLVGDAPVPVRSVYELLTEARTRLPHLRIEALHGQLSAADKHDLMTRFAAGGIDILVSTTVIEVGVNVPNATVMAVWDADRFGMAQLHQLRGRVGRGEHQSLCLLVTSTGDDHPARDRLDSVASTLDGHKLAKADLKSRREGDVTGTGQAGRSSFKLLDLTSADRVITRARKDATKIVKSDPGLRSHTVMAAWLHETLGADAANNLARS